MSPLPSLARRDLTLAVAGAALGAAAGPAAAADPPARAFRIGVISPGRQPFNGHIWHFAQYLHPTCDFDALKRHYPRLEPLFRKVLRNPRYRLDRLPFPDTRITHYYDADPKLAAPFAEAYPGVKVAASVEELVREVDAVWLGDVSGPGTDHFDLVAPGLARKLPTFCDKPIGGTVAGTAKILAFARERGAPLMSASAWRYEWGMEAALRMRDAGEFGPIEHVSARLFSRYKLESWMVYGQHPAWAAVTLMGAGVSAVSMVAHADACHALLTYADRYPCHLWYGQPYERFEYDRTDVYFRKKLYSFTPSIEGDYHFGYHYQMLGLASAFRRMVRTGEEPVPHREILDVTAVIHAGARSLREKGRLVELAEVMG